MDAAAGWVSREKGIKTPEDLFAVVFFKWTLETLFTDLNLSGLSDETCSKSGAISYACCEV